MIAKFTNEEAARRRSEEHTNTLSHPRPWKDTTGDEIGAFIGAQLLIGCHPSATDVNSYWQCSPNSPLYPLATYISRERFEQLCRYFKVSDSNDEDNKQESIDEDAELAKLMRKVSFLADRVRATSAANLHPGSILSIDEQLILCKGRSNNTIQMNSKAAGKGYKIYSLCSKAYLVDFLLSSRKGNIEGLSIFRPTYPTAPSTVRFS